MPAGGVGQYGKFPGTVTADCGSSQFLGSGRFWLPFGLLRIIPLTTMRCRFIAERIWVKKSAVSVHSTSTESDGTKDCGKHEEFDHGVSIPPTALSRTDTTRSISDRVTAAR